MAYAVLTRATDAIAAYAAALAPRGLDAVAMPVTRTAPAADPGALARALAGGGHAVIVVASAHGAAALAAARGAAPLPEVWAVGAATARALAAAGIAARVPGEARDAAALAEAVLAARPAPGLRVLVPRAEGGRDEAIDRLRAAGAEVEVIDAYRTVAAPADDPDLARGRDLLTAGRAAVCAVFAPSQVRALAALLGGDRALAAAPTAYLAIGQTTARALAAAGAAVAAVAAAATPEGLANAAAAVYPVRT